MTGEKRTSGQYRRHTSCCCSSQDQRLTSSDLSSRLNKRGGKLISKTLGKASSPPSISAPPKAAVGASKVKKDEVQRRKSSLHEMFRGSPKEQDSGQVALSAESGMSPTPTSPKNGSRRAVASRDMNAAETVGGGHLPRDEEPAISADDRLRSLEKALSLVNEETAALRLELERVKQDAQASIEISRSQASDVHQQATPEMNTQYHRPSQEHDDGASEREKDLLSQNHELRYRLAELQDLLNVQTTMPPAEVIHSEEDWNVMTLRLHEAEKESHSRLQQLLALKSSISSLTRTDSQVSDNELADSLSQLANKVREWVVSNYRRTKMNFDNLPEVTVQMLQSIKVDYKGVDPADKLALYQAILSRILMRIFDEPLLIGLPDHGVYAGLGDLSRGTQQTSPEFREWRRATLRMVMGSTQSAMIEEWRTQKLNTLALEFEAIMRSIASSELTPHAHAVLLGILAYAADLQGTLGLQKAAYSVVVFDTVHGQGHHLDCSAMEPVDDPEDTADDCDESHTRRRFIFCIFPCLKKIEDGVENIVFKARVCCGVG